MSTSRDDNVLTELKGLASGVGERVKTVAVLYGGNSVEREVSIASGTCVKQVLEQEGFEVLFLDTASRDFVGTILTAKPDVAFIALHGPGGEDGCIQGFLETLGIPYTHSGVESSALCMDKVVSKMIYEQAGLTVARHFLLSRDAVLASVDRSRTDSEHGSDDRPGAGIPADASLASAIDNKIDGYIERIGLPCVVKTICDGSSIGVYIPKNRSSFVQALIDGFALDDTLMVEQFISGIEVTVSVLGNATDELIALPIIEIVANSEFYDYEAKYSAGGSVHIIPARISDAEAAACNVAAEVAHRALKCSGVSRTDIIISADSTPYLIETNTVPGMTETSLVPDSARNYGLSTGELYRLLLHYALVR